MITRLRGIAGRGKNRRGPRLRRAPLYLLLSLALAFGVGCPRDGEDEHGHDEHDEHDEQGHDEHDDDEHGHDEHGEELELTAWSASHEFYMQHPRPVAGEPMHGHAHLTRLSDFQPVEGARMRLILEGPETLREVVTVRGGMADLEFTPRLAGTYRGRVELLDSEADAIDGFELVVVDEEEAERLEGISETPAEGIVFLKEQQWRVPFATAVVRRESLHPTMQATGEIATPPDGTAHIHAPVGGRIMAGRGGFPAPGLEVDAGDELATLAPTPGAPEEATQAGLQVVRAEAEVEEARAALARAERMLADRAIPEREVAESRRRVRVAESGLSAARRARSLYSAASSGRGRGSWRIVSPIAGVVDDVRVTPGEAVNPNELVFRVVNSDVRWVRTHVPEAWASRVTPSRGISLRLPGDVAWRSPEVELVYVARTIDPDSRTLEVIWRLVSSDEDFRVGASARVAVPIGETTEALVIPRTALVATAGTETVYVQVEGERFEERRVITAATDGARVGLASGIREGDRIVTIGANLVRLAEGGGADIDPHAGHVH